MYLSHFFDRRLHRCNQRQRGAACSQQIGFEFHYAAVHVAQSVHPSTRNSLRDKCPAALHGRQVGQEPAQLCKTFLSGSGEINIKTDQ